VRARWVGPLFIAFLVAGAACVPTKPPAGGRGADLSVTKTDSADPAIRDNPLEYTLTVENHGPRQARDVELVDTLPGSVSFEAAPASCSHTGGFQGGSGMTVRTRFPTRRPCSINCRMRCRSCPPARGAPTPARQWAAQ
jgi:uncharacterized repeat protein (TIGR01451 family)